MTGNPLLSTGIVAFYKGSLELSIINSKLIIQGGAAYGNEGEMLMLSEASYVASQSIVLTDFEDHQTYYFYLISNSCFQRLPMEHLFSYVQLEEEVCFFISIERQNTAILLGEVTIDYASNDGENANIIRVPKNAFAPTKNEIDTRKIKRLYPSLPYDQKYEELHKTLMKLSHAMLAQNICVEFSFLGTAFFQFADMLSYSSFPPDVLYRKFENHIKLLGLVNKDNLAPEIQQEIENLDTLFTMHQREYKTSYYYLDIVDEQGFFYQLLSNIKSLLSTLNHLQDVPSAKSTNTTSSSPLETEDVKISKIENITIVEDDDLEDGEHTTVLIGVDRNPQVQIGRGTQSGNDIVVCENDKTVSRVHLKITPHKQGFFLEDTSSMGTFVDGERIEKNSKKFVTVKNKIILGRKNCLVDLSHFKIQALLER